MLENNQISVIILAAGEGSRMGTVKQLLPWNNSTLIEHAINNAKGCKANKTMVVLGSQSEIIKEKLGNISPISLVKNTDWQSGMLSSIKCGIKSCSDSEAVIVTLVDQPSVNSDFLNKLIEQYHKDNNTIVATQYEKKLGVPVLFSKLHFKKLLSLENSKEGAKNYISQNIKGRAAIKPTFEIFDIDTPEQYNSYYKAFHNT